jgi:Protein of unknown function (DUF819)
MTVLLSFARQVAAALAARHIGGAVNYVAVAETTGMAASAQAAGMAADNLICAVYFTAIYALARGVPPDAPGDGSGLDRPAQPTAPSGIQVRRMDVWRRVCWANGWLCLSHVDACFRPTGWVCLICGAPASPVSPRWAGREASVDRPVRVCKNDPRQRDWSRRSLLVKSELCPSESTSVWLPMLSVCPSGPGGRDGARRRSQPLLGRHRVGGGVGAP